jgi:hypothetical protein
MKIDLFTKHEGAAVSGLVIFPTIKKPRFKNGEGVKNFKKFARDMQLASRIEYACEGGVPALWFFRRKGFLIRTEEQFCSHTFNEVGKDWCTKATSFSQEPLRARILFAKTDKRYPYGALVIEVKKKSRGFSEIFVDLFSSRASAG